MKKGFTLIELLGCIVILGILSVIAIPTILNKVKSEQENIDAVNESIFSVAAKLYVEQNDLKPNSGDCIKLGELVDEGLLETPVLDSDPNGEHSYVKITYSNNVEQYTFTEETCHIISK